jgi:hypothetical protein
MMSRSHQGMLSPPVKKLPTESKNLVILASIADLLGGRVGISVSGGGGGGGRCVVWTGAGGGFLVLDRAMDAERSSDG